MGDLADRLVHDTHAGEVRDGPRRYLLMRADVFSGALALVAPEHRGAVLDAFARSVALHGADSVGAYLDTLGGDTAALLATMPSAAADLGWGVWRFDPPGSSPGLALTVTNSPFVQAFEDQRAEQPVCAPIAGMLSALGQACFGVPVRCVESGCVARDGGHACRFEVVPLTPASPRRTP